MEFCKAFNAQTQKMEKDTPIPVVITIYSGPFLHLRDEDAAGVSTSSRRRPSSKAARRPRAAISPAQVTKAQVKEIAEQKMKDLNCDTIEAAMKMIEGSARSMGLTVAE